MLESLAQAVKGRGILEWRRKQDRTYLMSLTPENLLRPYYHEAGLTQITYMPKEIHDGWDSPLSMIRGTVCGHWLSAAAMLYAETGDMELKARADFLVQEIGRCQEENGEGWCFSIPEKYLLWLKRGKRTWAPQYVCHKTMAGLLKMYQLTGNQQALEILVKAADWFYRFTEDITPETMKEMMWEETGGMMELFADLYAVTASPKHLELMRRYERKELFELLEQGVNPLVNMHANTTVPEILGAARAYEVTGEERYRKLVERYWDLAVHEMGMFVTGGHSSGELWTPKEAQAQRLGNANQEHCLVYHMMCLAEYLFRWTGDAKYADYWERNLYNGIFAQGFYQEHIFEPTGGAGRAPRYGYVAYYLPLHAGAKKVWGSRTGDFWCCHNTLMEANASLNQALFYRDGDRIVCAQYQEADLECMINGKKVCLRQRIDPCAGDNIRVEKPNRTILTRPDFTRIKINLCCEEETRFGLSFRWPWWLKGEMEIQVDGEKRNLFRDEKGFVTLYGDWKSQEITVTLPKGITAWPLEGQPDMVAFLDGPIALAGLVEEERTLYYKEKPEEILKPDNERRWSQWLPDWKTVGQPVNFVFRPLNQIGYETYTTYFPIEKEIKHILN